MPFYFRIPLPGPFGYSKRIGGRKRGKRQPAYHGTLPGWKCEHNHRTESAAKACADREARSRGLVTAPAPARAPATHHQEPSMTYPEPAPYIYCTVTAARYSADRSHVTVDLLSDSGEVFDEITAPVDSDDPDPQELVRGGRLTYDGDSFGNYIGPEFLARYRDELVTKMNRLGGLERATARRDADLVQQFRNAGYVFNSDNRLVSAGRA